MMEPNNNELQNEEVLEKETSVSATISEDASEPDEASGVKEEVNSQEENDTSDAPDAVEVNDESEKGEETNAPEESSVEDEPVKSAEEIILGRSLVDIFEEAPSDTRKIDKVKIKDDEQDEMLSYSDVDAFEDDDFEERDYRPIRFSRTGRTGCLGGIMYAAFIICVSVALACFGWMAACDILALNKGDTKLQVVIPEEIFSEKEIDIFDGEGNKTGTQLIDVADVNEVSHILKDSGVIEYPWLFKIFAKLSNAERKIDPGTYEISTRFDYRALVINLQEAVAAKEIKSGVTFPEGYTMDQIFRKLEDEGVCSVEELYDAAANYHYDFSFLDESTLGDPKRLEGFIFPNTYDFYVGESASSVISKFLNTFHRQLYADMYQLCDNLGITFYEAVIIASMIEKEAANDEERAMIARVIYNRISAGMTLGIDATILYEHPEHVGVQIPTEILQEDSPYNTHIYKGLPPTPICNPGIASLEAALHPASHWYYYYALDTATGTHKFFYSIGEFNAFVETQDYDNYNP